MTSLVAAVLSDMPPHGPLCANMMTLFIKPEVTYWSTTREGLSHSNMHKKFGEDRT